MAADAVAEPAYPTTPASRQDERALLNFVKPPHCNGAAPARSSRSMHTVWLIGNFDCEATARLTAALPAANLCKFRTPTAALATAADEPDLILAIQHRPAEFCCGDIETLVGAHPLTRFVVALGPWCGSDRRSRPLWPAAVTVPLERAAGRLQRELAVLEDSRPPLPNTAASDEACLFDLPAETAPPPGPVGIVSPDAALAAWLRDLVRSIGGAIAAPDAADVVLWDVDPLCEATIAAVTNFHQRHPHCRIVPLAALPTAESPARLQACGAQVTLGKPCDLDALFTALTIVNP